MRIDEGGSEAAVGLGERAGARDDRDPYRRLRASVWPDILGLIANCNIRNDAIILREPEDRRFGTWAYHGADFTADMARMEADPTNAAWWRLTIPCQRPLESRSPDAGWAPMEEVFRRD